MYWKKTLDTFNTVPKSIKESNNNMTKNIKTLENRLTITSLNHYHRQDNFR